MAKLIEIALLLAIILMTAYVVQMDRDWDHVASTPEFEALRVKHGVLNTEVVWFEHGRNWYLNEQGERCELR